MRRAGGEQRAMQSIISHLPPWGIVFTKNMRRKVSSSRAVEDAGTAGGDPAKPLSLACEPSLPIREPDGSVMPAGRHCLRCWASTISMGLRVINLVVRASEYRAIKNGRILVGKFRHRSRPNIAQAAQGNAAPARVA